MLKKSWVLPRGNRLVLVLSFEEAREEITGVRGAVGVRLASPLCNARNPEADDWVLTNRY